MTGVDKEGREPGSDRNATSILQLYRALVQTATMWRQRLDVTANWAVPLLIALTTFALGDVALPHLLFLLLGGVLIGSAVLIEARRYRELHHSLWRTYLIEVGWFAQRLSHVEIAPRWRSALAADLCRPRPSVTMAAAFLARMRGSYLVLLYLLVLAWLCKVVIHPRVAVSLGEVFERLSVGFVPGEWFAGALAALLAALTTVTLLSPSLADLENWLSHPSLQGSGAESPAMAANQDAPEPAPRNSSDSP